MKIVITIISTVVVVGLLTVLIILSTPTNLNDNIGENMNTIPDFNEIFESDLTKREYKSRSVDDVAKITFLSNYNLLMAEFVAINLKEKKLFIEPDYPRHLDTYNADYKMTEDDVEYVKNLIEEYGILSWQYGFRGKGLGSGAPDDRGGYELVIQYDDAAILLSSGVEPHYNGHQEFVDKIVQFCRSKERNILQDFWQMELESIWYEKPNDVEQNAQDITKIYYYETGEDWISNEIYLDIKDGFLYYDETISYITFNNKQPTYKMSETEANEFVDMVEKYNVLSWKGKHSNYLEIGNRPYIGWVLILQFENCSLHVASGDTVNQEGQAEFVKEMRDLIMSKTPNIEISE